MQAESSLCRGFRPKPPRSSNCVAVPEKIIKQPDPAIYDQTLVLASGGVPSWDSPDLYTHDFPGFVPLGRVDALIHNLAGDASACNVGVQFAWSQFGIGMDRNVIGTVPVNLGPGDTQKVTIPTPTAMNAAVRFNVFVTLSHPYDKDPTNNEGEQAFDFQTTGVVGRTMVFHFPVKNRFNATVDVNLLIDPVQWGVAAVPSTFTLTAGAQTDVDVTISIPAAVPSGTLQLFSVYAVTPLGLLGGVGLFCNVD